MSAGLRSRNLILGKECLSRIEIVSQEGHNIHFLVNSDIVNYLLKTNGGQTKDLLFFFFFFSFFVVWSALIVDGSMVVMWSRKSYLGPGEIVSLLIASAKILDREESKLLSSFYEQLPNYQSNVLALPTWCLFLLLKSRSARRASCDPAFMGNCPTISHMCQPNLPSR